MKEKEFMAQVIDVAHANHWLCAHFRAAMMANGHWVTPVQADGKGFPDCVFVRKPHIRFVEFKSETGVLSPEQVMWLGNLRECNSVETSIWRPSDSEEIIKVLGGGNASR